LVETAKIKRLGVPTTTNLSPQHRFHPPD
jgi:hypothetical protein